MYSIFIHGIEFYGFHGVPPEERVVGHRYRVDVDLVVDGMANSSDAIEDTVDYGRLGQLIVQIGTQETVYTVERLAQLIGERILEAAPLAQQAKVRVAKPLPPAPIIAEVAGVELVVNR